MLIIFNMNSFILFEVYEVAGFLIFFVIFILGICLGSFLNSWIWRRHENIRISRGRSICPHCRRRLRCFENIPILSYFFLKGMCRTCKNKIAWHYTAVEFGTGLLLTFIFWHHLEHWQISEYWHLSLIKSIFFATFLIIIFIFDALYQIILPRVIWLGCLVGFLMNYYLDNFSVFSMFIGALIGGGFFLIQYLISRGKWIGGGDVRLGVMMGIWLGWQYVIEAIFLSYLIGSLIYLPLLLFKKKKLQSQIPFGSFLAFSTFIIVYLGDNILNWYLGLLK